MKKLLALLIFCLVIPLSAQQTDRDLLIQLQNLINQQIAAPVPVPTPANAIHVVKGSNLQTAIDAAPVGSTLSIDPGDYSPIFLTKQLTLKSSGNVPVRRILGTDDPTQFVRISATGQPAIALTAPATIIGFRVTRSDTGPGIISIDGDWASTDWITNVATISRCWIVGGSLGSRRGIAANGSRTLIFQTRVENIWFQGQDAQAVASWTGPGPLQINDSYLEGSTETVLIGGSDPKDQAHNPVNFWLRRSTLTKQLAWKNKPGSVKNTLELKNVFGAVIENNIIEYSWVDGQSGYILVLTPRDQDGTASYSNVRDIVVRRNLFRHGAGGVNVLGTDNLATSGRMTNVLITNNRFEDIDAVAYGGNGRVILVTAGPDKLTFDHNTFLGNNLNSFITFGNYPSDKGTTTGFVFTNNIVSEGQYGLIGDSLGLGKAATDYYAPSAMWANNWVIKQQPYTITYPTGTTYGTEQQGIAAGAGTIGYPTGQ